MKKNPQQKVNIAYLVILHIKESNKVEITIEMKINNTIKKKTRIYEEIMRR
jgi:hypothetical protein